MTIAIDIRTGKPCGQVVGGNWYYDGPWGMLGGTIELLTREGYVQVPASSVRLERVERVT